MNFPPAFHILKELPSDDPAPRLDVVRRVGAATGTQREGRHGSEVTQRELDHAREQGIEQGRAAATAHYELKLQEQRESWGSELQSARDTWEEAVGQELRDALEAGIDAMRQELAATLVETLRPFMRRSLCDAAVKDLTEAVVEILSEPESAKVEVVGPAPLVDGFERAASGRVQVSAVIDNACTDLVVTVGSSVLSTRIGEWLGKLEIEG